MKKTFLLVAGTALLFAGCARIENKLNRMMGSATPTPAPTATPLPTAMPKATAMPKPTVTPKMITPKPAMKK